MKSDKNIVWDSMPIKRIKQEIKTIEMNRYFKGVISQEEANLLFKLQQLLK